VTKAKRAMTTAMRLAGKEEGEDGKAMVLATSMVGKRMVMVTKRVMATKTRKAGKEEGN
jgi:hypothetical protein